MISRGFSAAVPVCALAFALLVGHPAPALAVGVGVPPAPQAVAAATPAARAPEQLSPEVFTREGAPFDADHHPGKEVFASICAACHLGQAPRAPHRDFLEMMQPDAILKALNEGVMQQQAAALTPDQRIQVAEYLVRADRKDWKTPPAPVMCTGEAARFDLSRPPAPVGWGYDNKRFTPAAVAGLEAADVPRLKLKWAFAFPSALRARSQPVAAMGAVFVGSHDGSVYAFDLETGCVRWTSKVSAEVRTAVVVEPWAPGTKPARNPRLFFGDLLGRVYAMDALTGQVLWRARPDDHANATITGTPTPYGDTLYVPVSSLEVVSAIDEKYACCTFRGSVTALDLNTGAIRWKHYTVEQPPGEQGLTRVATKILGPSGAPVWSTPTIDAKRGVLYHGSGENYSSPADRNSDSMFAVDLRTGARRWQYQFTHGDAWNSTCATSLDHPNCPRERGPDLDLSASPLLIDLGKGKEIVVATSKGGMTVAVDPDAGGKLLWQTRVGRGSIQGGVHFGMAAEGTRVYVPISDLNMNSMGLPIGEPGRPGMHAIDARTGRILWSTIHEDRCGGKKYCDPGVSAAATAIPGVVFGGAMDGTLRAYDGKTGRVLWSVDTTGPAQTANGEIAHGGSMSGSGPLVIDGHVIVNSGYGFSYHMPGNALLVYSVDGR